MPESGYHYDETFIETFVKTPDRLPGDVQRTFLDRMTRDAGLRAYVHFLSVFYEALDAPARPPARLAAFVDTLFDAPRPGRRSAPVPPAGQAPPVSKIC